LLLSLPARIKLVTVKIDKAAITNEVRMFRKTLEKRTTREYLPHAQVLYDRLIRPLEADLQAGKIDTLIVIPDDPLRTIPLAALHDGKEFLIQKYAVATTPGLSLTDPHPIRQAGARFLLSGLTQGSQRFPPLPYVEEELQSIAKLYDSRILANEEFRVAQVQSELSRVPFSVVHIASHGQFRSDVGESFLLAFDGKIKMDTLEQVMGTSRFRDRPVELLTLSACQTAAGDDRAALGLAGIAVKAGARSALASLWLINDRASALLVSEFYRQLRDPNLSKARALQSAQRAMLDDQRYRHPGYWAPFLLIGNWL
jgi:CHAT domain-containing protein